MPPTHKKKKACYAKPPLSFVTSPTPSTIKFPNTGSSQSQPLEVPTVPYKEGGKWLAMQFTQSDAKAIKLSGRKRGKSQPDFNVIKQNTRKCGVVYGCEPTNQLSRSRNSTTSYVPLEVTVSKIPTTKKQHLRERISDVVADNSSHTSADESTRTIVNDNSVCIQSENIDVAPPFAFSVKTPVFEGGNLETTNSDKAWRLTSRGVLNLNDSSDNDIRMEALKGKDNCSSSPKCKDRHSQGLFQSSGSDECDFQTSEVLAPDTPEHECGLTFYQRRLKKRQSDAKQPG